MLDERGRRVRRMLRLAAEALVERGLIDGSRLGSFKGHKGYENVAFDLLGYVILGRALAEDRCVLLLERLQLLANEEGEIDYLFESVDRIYRHRPPTSPVGMRALQLDFVR
jgi:hypothetical protein